MKKIKRFLRSRFLDKPMNIALLISCIVIVLVQLYFILDIWVENCIEKLYVIISNNQLLLAAIASIIPLLPNVFLKTIKKINEKKDMENNVYKKYTPEKTEVFPGAITHEMIVDKDVVLISKRTLKTASEKKPMILDRQKQCDDIVQYINKLYDGGIKNKLNCLFLTGTSGAGKSILLNEFLMKRLNPDNKGDLTETDINTNTNHYKCLYFNNYDDGCDLIYDNIIFEDANIVIMDQFESSINYPEIYRYIKELIRTVDGILIFVFSFPQDIFDQISLNIMNYIVKDGKDDKDSLNLDIFTCTHFLGYDEHDIMQLKILINTFLKVGMDKVDECLDYSVDTFLNHGSFMPVLNLGKYPSSLVFLCSVLARIKAGKSPLVEFSAVSYIYELYKEEIDYNVDKYIDELNKIFELYLNHWVDKFPNTEMGKIILQLISDGRKYTVDDLKCVTFEPSECFTLPQNKDDEGKQKLPFSIFATLKQNQFIRVQENYFGFKFGVFAAHDFIALKMSEYCFETLDNELRQNVDYYKRKMVQTNHGYSMQTESKTKSKILKRYESFHTKQNQLFINVLVYIVMMSSILISCIKGYQYKEYHDNVFYIFIGIGCFFSTYYLYNVIMQFFRMLKKRYYYPLTICGTILIILCYVLPDYWGVFSGIEIVILGMSLYSARKGTVGLAVEFFRDKGIFYAVLGLVVIGFGMEFAYVRESLMLKYTLAVFFIIYVAASNFTHIKYSYIINKIGMGNTI